MGPIPVQAQHLKVSSLINSASGTWNIDAIRSLLPHYETKIRQIHLSSSSMMDTIIWLPEKTGTYSTKTGYSLSKAQQQPLPLENFNWKKHIWNLRTSPKLQSFLWKLRIKALPVGSNLSTRGASENINCQRCGLYETEIHMVYECSFAQRVWTLLPLAHQSPFINDISLDSLFSKGLSMVTLPPCGITIPLFPWTAWHLRKARNSLVFETRYIPEEEIVTSILLDSKEWQSAQLQQPGHQQPATTSYKRQPSTTALSCFTDAAWNSSSLHSGSGWCFLDPHSTRLAQGSDTHRFISSALMAEAIALKAALEAAISFEFQHLNVFSDSQSLVSLLVSNGDDNELRSVLVDIRSLLESLSFISFFYVPRSANGYADALAKSALASM